VDERIPVDDEERAADDLPAGSWRSSMRTALTIFSKTPLRSSLLEAEEASKRGKRRSGRSTVDDRFPPTV